MPQKKVRAIPYWSVWGEDVGPVLCCSFVEQVQAASAREAVVPVARLWQARGLLDGEQASLRGPGYLLFVLIAKGLGDLPRQVARYTITYRCQVTRKVRAVPMRRPHDKNKKVME